MGRRLQTTLVVLFTFALASALFVGVGAAQEGSEAAQEDSDLVRLENLETGEVYYVSADAPLRSADVPAGEYLATYTEDGEDVQEYIEIESGSTIDPQATSSGSIQLATLVATKGVDTLDSESTVNITAGAVNTSSNVLQPESGIDLVINITRPNGTVDTFRQTTGPNGTVNLTYNLAGKEDGEYDVRVASPNASDTGFERFNVGPAPIGIFPGINDAMIVNETSTFAVLVTEARKPVTNKTVNVSIRHPNGTEVVKKVTTNKYGFGVFEFAPSQQGRYSFDSGSAFQSYTAGVAAGSTYMNGESFQADIPPNGSVAIQGTLYEGGTVYANQGVEIQIINETDYRNRTTETVLTTQTDKFGQYSVTWSPGPNTVGDFEGNVTTPDGDRIITSDARIDIQPKRETGPVGAEGLEVETKIGGDSYIGAVKPGTTTKLVVEVTENGTAVSGAEVSLVSYFGFEEIPFGATTVTTNQSGIATRQITVPASAPDGESVNVVASVTVDGKTDTDDDSVDIQRFTVSDRRGSARSGSQMKFSLIAEDLETSAGISGVPLTVIGESHEQRAFVFSPRSATTNTSGIATATLRVPEEVAGEFHLGDQAPYEDVNGYPRIQIQDFKVTVNGLDQFEYDAGSTLQINYSTSSSENVSAVQVFASFDEFEDQVLFADRVSEGENVSINIPASVPDGVGYSLDIRAISESGDTATGYGSARVRNEGRTPTPTPTTPTPTPSTATATPTTSTATGTMTNATSDTPTPDDGESVSSGQPGFGVVVMLVSLLLAAVLATRRSQ